MLLQPRNQNIAVGFVVVDHEDEGGIVHARLAIDDSVVEAKRLAILGGQKLLDLCQ
jgi:hypothetical protein